MEEMSQNGKRKTMDRRVVRTKKAIREAFLKLLEEQDYAKITISSVSRFADIDRKTFYLHYRTIEDVVDEILRGEVDVIVGYCRKAFVEDGSRVNAEMLFLLLRETIESDLGTLSLLMRRCSVGLIIDKMELLLTESFMEDDYLGLGTRDPYLVYHVTFFIAGLMGVYQRWLDDDNRISLEEVAQAASVAMSEGVNGVLKTLPEE